MSAAALQSRPLFATRVYLFDLESERVPALNATLLAEIERLLPSRSPDKTWQTHPDMQRNVAFVPLLEIVQAAARQMAKELGLAATGFRITGCWANVNPPGLAHQAHSHPNNLFSGVYYVTTDKGADLITFVDPRPQVLQVLPRFAKPTLETMTEMNIPTPEGRLLLFPGWLVHAVPANLSNRERVSVSFNLMPEGWGGA